MTRPIGRNALATRVRAQADSAGIADQRMRLWVGAAALLQVLASAVLEGAFPAFYVKGGFALELRFRRHARASQDIDLVVPIDMASIVAAFRTALAGRSWDNFTFRVKDTVREREHVMQVSVQSEYLGGPWCSLIIELGGGEIEDREMVEAFPLQPFGLRNPDRVPCLNRFAQIAQKLHAASDPSPQNMRYRDLVDIFLLDSMLERDDAKLRANIEETFTRRAQHPWPSPITMKPGWREPLTRMLNDMGLELTVDQIHGHVVELIARILGIEMATNFEYVFMVLEGWHQVPDVTSFAIKNDDRYNTFVRMTSQEGYRLVHLLRYPSTTVTTAMLAVLERPKPEPT